MVVVAPPNPAVRALDIAISFVEREEKRLRAIMESDAFSGEEKFQALQDLAYLSGVVVRELAGAHTASEKPEGATSKAQVVETIGPAGAHNAKRPAALHGRGVHAGAKETPFRLDVCDNFSEGVYFVDKTRKITYWNRGARNLTGFERDEAIGRHCHDNFLKHEDEQGRCLCQVGCPLAATLEDGQAREAEVFLHHKNGHKVPVAVRVSPVVNKLGKLIGAVEVFSNVASQKELERRTKEFEEPKHRDLRIELKLRQTLEELQEFGRKAGVLLQEIDGGQWGNRDGDPAGEVALKTVGEPPTEALPPDDAAGRWVGEEFLLVALQATFVDLEALAERCRNAIDECRTPVEAARAGAR
jgi:PAS domain S-box-containing protein